MEAFVLIVGIVVGILGWKWHKRRSAIRSWSDLAADHDLEFFEPSWFSEFSMSGSYDGVSVEVYTETRNSGKHSKTYMVYAASLPEAVPVDMVVHNEGMFSQVGKLFGGQDIEVGDPEVDDAFIFKSDHPTELHEFFEKPNVREAFQKLARTGRSVQIEYGSIQIEERGLEPDREGLEHGLQVVAGFARDLQRALADRTGAAIESRGGEASPAASTDDEGEPPAGSEEPFEDEEFAVEW